MSEILVRAKNLKFRYPDTEKLALDDISFEIRRGEVIGIIGPNGAGKTTLCSAIKGIVPHKTGGAWGGELEVCGVNVRSESTAKLVPHVSMTFQNPETQILGTTVEEDLAFTPESLGVAPEEIRRRMDQVMDTVRLPRDYKKRAPFRMSGGEKQRLAIAASIISAPDIVILDEPTTELDPVGKAEVLQIVGKLAQSGENTVIVVEQDIDYLVTVADRLIVLEDGKLIAQGPVREVMAHTEFLKKAKINVPDVSLLWQDMGFSRKYPVFLTVGEARSALKAEGVTEHAPERPDVPGEPLARACACGGEQQSVGAACGGEQSVAAACGREQPTSVAASYDHTVFSYGEREILKGITQSVQTGDFIAVLGRNGAGKTTMVKHLNGLLKPTAGCVAVCGKDTKSSSVADLAHHTAYVFQNPDHQLFNQTVEEEIAFGPRNLGWSEPQVKEAVDRAVELSGLGPWREETPLSLERGLKQILILACVIAMDVDIFVVDEPTTGLSKSYKDRIGEILDRLNQNGKTILLVTHDMQFVAEHAKKIWVVQDGDVALNGGVREIFKEEGRLREACLFPPQITQLALALGWETVPLDNREFMEVAGYECSR